MFVFFALALLGFNTLIIFAACVRSSQLTWQEPGLDAQSTSESTKVKNDQIR